jgi:predicted dienelactone hydrolase
MKTLGRSCGRTTAFGALILVSVGLEACGGDSGGGGPPITVSTPADLGTLQPGATVQLAATVSNDAANRGVSWSVSCSAAPCGTVSPTATASGAATTYSAPTTRPPADLAVSITATSVSDLAVAASTKVTVAGGIAISITPGDNTVVAATTSMTFTATVINDPANGGVTWTLSCSPAPCGTVSPATTASGAPTTYTAPPTPLGSDLAVTLTATAVSNSAISTSVMVIVPGLTVVIAPSSSPPVPAGASAQFTATVNNDPANQGVNWTLQCSAMDCGSVSPPTSASGALVTYRAPASPPPADLTVTLTASSASAPSVQSGVRFRVPAVAVLITPVSALIPLNVTQQFTATVSYDPTASSIAWTLTQDSVPCPSACGSVSSALTPNGTAITYTAPAAVPANATVTLTATSVPDQASSTFATVTLTTGTVQLAPADMSFVKTMHNHLPPPQVATLTNTGNTALTISDISIGGANPLKFSQTNTCGSSVAPASSCDITVSDLVSIGTATAVLSITDSSSDSPQLLHLSASVHYQITAAMRTALAGQTRAVVPPPTGGSQVGSREMHLIDSTRADPYLSNGMKRELMVRFWYPAAAGTTCAAAAPYTSPQVWSYFGELLGVSLPRVSTNSCLNAPITAGAHPVVVFSHGFTGTFTDYTFLVEDLASRGYVVASVDHTREATAVEFPDGRLEKSLFGSHLAKYLRNDAGALGLAVTVRLEDLRFVLDELERLNAGRDSHFAAKLDLSRIALAGHSLGGLTTLRAMEREPRFKAGVLLDGVMPPHLASPMHQAVLMLVAGRGQWNDDDCRLWNELRGPRLAVNFPGAEHIALSDAIWLLKGIVKTGAASPEQGIAAIREYVATFLDSNLRGFNAVLPTRPVPSYPNAVVATQAQTLCEQQ